MKRATIALLLAMPALAMTGCPQAHGGPQPGDAPLTGGAPSRAGNGPAAAAETGPWPAAGGALATVTPGLPAYRHADQNLRVAFDRNLLTVENATSGPVTLVSAWLYYNDKVVKLKVADRELPPRSAGTALDLTPSVAYLNADMTYRNVTRESAMNTEIRFGFALRYRIGNSAAEQTLFKVDAHTLYTMMTSRGL